MKMSCAVCKGTDGVSLEDAPLHQYRCARCGHVFKDLPKEKQERYGAEYFSGEHKNWFNTPDYPLFELIRRKILDISGDRPLRLLDVGCGKGHFLRYIRERNSAFELYGIDLTENFDNEIHFIKGDVLKEDLGMKFDVISNIAVIEHLDRPYLFASRLKDLLSPDGILFTVTDNDDSMIYRAARLLRKIGMDDAYNRMYAVHHLQCFSRRSLALFMESSGLKPIMQRNHNHPIEAVDYPDANMIKMALHVAGIHLIFFLSTLFGKGILQVMICENGADEIKSGYGA